MQNYTYYSLISRLCFSIFVAEVRRPWNDTTVLSKSSVSCYCHALRQRLRPTGPVFDIVALSAPWRAFLCFLCHQKQVARSTISDGGQFEAIIDCGVTFRAIATRRNLRLRIIW